MVELIDESGKESRSFPARESQETGGSKSPTSSPVIQPRHPANQPEKHTEYTNRQSIHQLICFQGGGLTSKAPNSGEY